MNKVFFYLLPIMVVCLAACQNSNGPSDCSQFKTGTFTYINSQTGDTFRVERNDSMQYETVLRTGEAVALKVRWINACEYELTQPYRPIPGEPTLATAPQPKILTSKILKLGTNYYVYASHLDGQDFGLSDTLWVAKK